MLSRLKTEPKLVGLKQSQKAIQEGRAAAAFMAEDADIRLQDQISRLCEEHQVELYGVATMAELGQACGIEVGAAVAVLLK